LLALTADPPDASAIGRDPAAVAHVLRFARPTPDPQHFSLSVELLNQPSLCSNAADLLEATCAQLPSRREPDAADRVANFAAELAARLAEQFDVCSPDAAACAARLAPLGWYALRAVNTTNIIAEDAVSIGRRLAGRWRLPPWLVGVIGFLKLPPADAQRLGAPVGLFRIVQAAVAEAERRVMRLGLTPAPDARPRDAFADAARELADYLPEPDDAAEAETLTPLPLLVRLLRATAQAHRATGAVWLADAEERTDRLADALADLRAEFDTEIRDAKLASLAEFAAGASHEINNPLAVISGHAQLLLAQEVDADRQKQLATIIRQTKRVHDLLQGTLQFARPPKPHRAATHFADWLADAVALAQPDAEAKAVTFTCDPAPPELLHADAGQLKQALGHLLRNAIEAAPVGGWVHVCVEGRADEWLIAVEDSGPGPVPAQVPHLFDPFFSGRAAGRGRGLGLSIAWRLARINGGDVRYEYECAFNGPTRFVLTVPRESQPVINRLSA
jgi:signal transduction histidine kinase